MEGPPDKKPLLGADHLGSRGPSQPQLVLLHFSEIQAENGSIGIFNKGGWKRERQLEEAGRGDEAQIHGQNSVLETDRLRMGALGSGRRTETRSS